MIKGINGATGQIYPHATPGKKLRLMCRRGLRDSGIA